MNPDLTYIAEADHRLNYRPFGIRQKDRFLHMYILGRTGTGKSTLLRILAEQDIAAGRGLALFDPHGDLVSGLAQSEHSRKDVFLVEPASFDSTFTFNPLSGISDEQRPLAAAALVDTFKKIWSDDWGPRLEHLLRNVLLTLLEFPESTLGDIPQLLADYQQRKAIAEQLSDPLVRSFWLDEFARYSPGFRAVVIAPLQNKLGALLSDPRLRRILTAQKSSPDLAEAMEKGQVLLVNLSKGQLGEGPASLLGSLLVSQLALAGLARADQPEESRKPFFVYLDEFHLFSTHMLSTMLAELRKYRVGLILAHQYLDQLEPEIRDAVLGNVGTTICFRLGAKDASFMAREFPPKLEPENFLYLPNYHLYLKLMIDGQPSRPFSAKTRDFPP